ncbi:MAG: response regulator [Deltaproteobacteria bacterium]|nr:response regulator [Deltaproteobacteria bacterium]
MSKPLVLFVDDEENVLNSAKKQLLEDEIEVLTTTDPFCALEILQKKNVTVIVVDNIMPLMKGIELLFKARSVSPETVRIMLTGYVDVNSVMEAVNIGAVYKFIVKPWEQEELKSAVLDGIYRYEMVHKLRDASEDQILELAQIIELRDPYTHGHCERVAEYALLLSDALSLDPGVRNEIKYGAWLHDCGKLGVPENILNKRDLLTFEEMRIVRNHPVWGAEVVRLAGLSETVAQIVNYHHEKYDGSGYPVGLKGSSIPLEARIVAIADIFDSLTSERPYRRKLSFHEAIQILLKEKGIVSDPEMVEFFIYLIEKSL